MSEGMPSCNKEFMSLISCLLKWMQDIAEALAKMPTLHTYCIRTLSIRGYAQRETSISYDSVKCVEVTCGDSFIDALK